MDWPALVALIAVLAIVLGILIIGAYLVLYLYTA